MTLEQPRVVYLLGAGASAQALPMVIGIPGVLKSHEDWLFGFAKESKSDEPLIPGNPKTGYHKILTEYFKVIQCLGAESAAHESIDTYAKKLFLRSKTIGGKAHQVKLSELRIGLSFFMAFLQAKKKEADKRYDGFLASTLALAEEGYLTFPEDVLLLNWNYDQQVALAFNSYQDHGDLTGSIAQLGLRPLEMLELPGPCPCRGVHLNGMFAYRTKFDEIKPLLELETNKDEEMLRALLKAYAHVLYSGEVGYNRLLLKFAWEVTEEHTKAMQILQHSLGRCEVLVVVGYSFPFFNREVDRDLIGSMHSLRRIYVQAPEGAAQQIARTVETMQRPNGAKVEPYGNTDKFLLPLEL